MTTAAPGAPGAPGPLGAPGAAGAQPSGGAPPAAPTPPVPPAPDAGAEITLSSSALKARLDEQAAAARKSLLKEYGLDKQDDLKARLDELQKLRDEKLTAEERTKKALDEATARAAAGEAHNATAVAALDALMATLTEAERAVIDEQAPETPAARLAMIRMVRRLRPAASPAAPLGALPPAAPTTLAPPGGPPRPAAAQTAFQKWAAMPAGSLTSAAFYQAHKSAIEASRPPPGA